MAVDNTALFPFANVQPFDPHGHLMQIKNKGGATDYLPVQWRLVWFRQFCPEGIIETEMVHFDPNMETEEEVYVWNNEKRRSEKVIKQARGFAVFKATVKDGKGGMATGYKSEKAASFGDYLEKAETGSVGRALAALGYGTQFVGDDYAEGHRIVDSPVEKHEPTAQEKEAYQKRRQVVDAVPGEVRSAVPETAEDVAATEQQLSSIRKLCERLGKPEPETPASFTAAKELIGQLTAEYRKDKPTYDPNAQPAKPQPVKTAEAQVEPSPAADLRDGAAPTEGQLSSIRNLCKLTNTELAGGMPQTYGAAVKLINTLNDVYKKSRVKK